MFFAKARMGWKRPWRTGRPAAGHIALNQQGIFRHHPERDARKLLRHSGAHLTRRRAGHDTG